MRINTLIIMISALLLVYSCRNKKTDNTNHSVESITMNQNANENLLSKIKKFVSMVDSIPGSREFQNVIVVAFNKKSDSLFVDIKTCYYYPDSIDGYFLLDFYMIAFYNSSLCPDKDLLMKFSKVTIPKNYESENEVHFGPFEPRIKKYLFIKPDSLKLIKYTIH